MTRIRVFGLILILFAAYGAFYLFFGPGARDRPEHVKGFLTLVTVFYVAAGLGALFPSRPGYYAFKAFLYISVLAFPIGTIIGLTTLSYMRRHELKREFGFASST